MSIDVTADSQASPRITLQELADDLGRPYDSQALTKLALYMQFAQAKRVERDSSKTESITRTTAVAAAGLCDSTVFEVLESHGFSWETYLEEVSLRRSDFTESPKSSLPGYLHAHLYEALSTFMAARVESDAELDARNVVAAILDSIRDDTESHVLRCLTVAGLNSRRLDSIIDDLVSAMPGFSTPGSGSARDPNDQPRVWLLQFKDESAPDFGRSDGNGGVRWRSTKNMGDKIAVGDPVIYWRSITDPKKDRGGIVGTGQFLGEAPAEKSSSGKTTYWYKTRYVDIFPDKPLPRDEVVSAAELDLNWSHGAIQEVPPASAARLNTFLQLNGRRGLFDDTSSRRSSDVILMDDTPDTTTDTLNRSDLALILASRLNRVWEEMNQSAPQSGAEEKSFIVHLDSPWGGGKTTFANYLGNILNPHSDQRKDLAWRARLKLDDEKIWPREFRRPWHIVNFNAWQHERVDPPWWCLYEAIIKQTQGNLAANEEFTADNTPESNGSLSERGHRWWQRVSLKLAEHKFRIITPAVAWSSLTFLVTVLLAIGLVSSGVLSLSGGELTPSGTGAGAALSLLLLGGAASLVKFVSSFMKSLAPGTPESALNYSLGTGDPLERFRQHFTWRMKRLDNPVLVIIDDVDRCEPQVVVELFRGIQTIFGCSRVCFLVLGDRQWMECCFEEQYENMRSTQLLSNSQHSLGARFMEKAIQLSFILPSIPEDKTTGYVDALLRGEAVSEGTEAAGVVDAQVSLEAIFAAPDRAQRESEAKSIKDTIESNDSLDTATKDNLVREVNRNMAFISAADPRNQEYTQHMLTPLASILPANPRQIKRTINSVSLFQEIARVEAHIDPETTRWCKLALWIVLMNNSSSTWGRLSAHPELLDAVAQGELPDESQQLEETFKQLGECHYLKRVLDFRSEEGPWNGVRLTADDITSFNQFIPPPGSD